VVVLTRVKRAVAENLIDSSALLAILQDEPEGRSFTERIESAARRRVSTASFVKGRRPAGLNVGDCFADALARVRAELLLFKGAAFDQTDIDPSVLVGRSGRGRRRVRAWTSSHWGYSWGYSQSLRAGMVAMPKVSVYLPDELYRRARERGLKLSALTQAAIEEQLAADPNGAWVRRVSARSPRCETPIDTAALLDDVRDEFGA
jgi:post-segregation antitoxin (ccd killing protein)